MRSVYDLTTEEAYRLVRGHFGHDLPPLEAVENEDWGRDYVLQHFQRHTAEELARVGLTWDGPGGGSAAENPEPPTGDRTSRPREST